ncbi:hypothetical protein [Xenorhabdus griffiniae]|uniref:hypothetical protein n=1 Tax=Xenorhabdus griffiniae TaxID=351672 RepID=UPI00235A189A|nr:hypothetical protein [Xenorhabdus griffiniae]MDC9607361.1 hypothetical protein [Xenorhabdus griffiniae]
MKSREFITRSNHWEHDPAPHHSSAVYVKRNILYNTFMPHRLLNRQTFDSWALDFLLFGNSYLELRKNRLGQPYPFPTGQVFHLIEPDINQELYGLPEYLAAHRVPPPMMGIIPQNTGGFGDVEKAAKVFVRNELLPLQSKMKQLNDWLGEEVIRFEPYSLDGDS